MVKKKVDIKEELPGDLPSVELERKLTQAIQRDHMDIVADLEKRLADLEGQLKSKGIIY